MKQLTMDEGGLNLNSTLGYTGERTLYMPKRGAPSEKGATRKRQKYDRSKVLDRIRLLVDIMSVQASWKQVDFARKAGITTPKLSNYLSGRYHPDIDSVASIAEKIGVSMEWLVFGAGPMWARDLEYPAVGPNEMALAFSSVLVDIAEQVRNSVISKPDHEDELGIGEAISVLLERNIDQVAVGA